MTSAASAWGVLALIAAGCASPVRGAATPAAALSPSDDPVVCHDAAAELHAFWAPDAQLRIRSAILAVPHLGSDAAATLVVSQMDALGKDWALATARNCAKDSAVAPRARARIGRCLDEARMMQQTLSEALSSADVDTLLNVESLIPSLSERIASCGREPVYSFYARPEASRDKAAAETAARALAQVHVLSRLKRKRDTEKALAEASRAAPATGDVRLQVDVLIATGTHLNETSQTAPALEPAKQALAQATAARYLVGQARATRLLGAIAADQGNPIAALEWLEKSRKLSLQLFGPDTLETSSVYERLGNVRLEQQEFGQAIPAFQTALARAKPLLVADHPLLLALESKLAITHRGRAEFGPALEQLTSVLERSSRLPLSQQAVADLYTNIGNVHSDRGDFGAALTWFEKAQALYVDVLGEGREGAGNTLNSIALAHSHQGNYQQALGEYRAAMALFEQLLGKHSYRVGVVCSNLGTLHDEMGQYRAALEWHDKALAVFKQTRGENHPMTAMAYNNIGLVNLTLGDQRKALQFLERARMIKEATLGPAHPTTASTYNNIGLVYAGLKQYEQALSWHKKALAIEEQALGPEHPTTASSYQNIGSAHAGLGRYTEALRWYEKALIVKERAFGTDHPSTARTYNNIGAIKIRMLDYEGALESHKRALAIRERVFGKDHTVTAGSYNNLGAVEATRGRYDEALKWFRLTLDIRQRKLGPDHPATRAARENIEHVEDLMQKPERRAKP